ncbi:MAG: hypothetical protein EU550_00215 [Promethearchaeota archaeon]|nr:MAG: hypothetical protein EU550_00215 [Candidatus Lokiarchaeota archaeon]
MYIFPFLIKPTLLTIESSQHIYIQTYLLLFLFILSIVALTISARSIQQLKPYRAIPIIIIGMILYIVNLYSNRSTEYSEIRLIPLFCDLTIYFILLFASILFYVFKIEEETFEGYSDIALTLKGWKEFIRRKELRPEKREIVKANFSYINKLIKNDKIKTALEELNILDSIIQKFNLKDLSEKVNDLMNFCKILEIKDFLLDKGTQYSIIKIEEIMERINIDKEDIIISTINSMINKKEIYAEYFKSTKSLKFDKRVNIREIDKLIEVYKKWEMDGIGKRE